MGDKLGFYGTTPTEEEQEKNAEERAKQLEIWEVQHPYIDDMTFNELIDYVKKVIFTLSPKDREVFLKGIMS
jgi:hypothetical protein